MSSDEDESVQGLKRVYGECKDPSGLYTPVTTHSIADIRAGFPSFWDICNRRLGRQCHVCEEYVNDDHDEILIIRLKGGDLWCGCLSENHRT